MKITKSGCRTRAGRRDAGMALADPADENAGTWRSPDEHRQMTGFATWLWPYCSGQPAGSPSQDRSEWQIEWQTALAAAVFVLVAA
jgi:hypothetical protein